tara:strand:+ start:19098 stop:19736 length:639 start_codon:yes stop_codon:yes gene_type:complete
MAVSSGCKDFDRFFGGFEKGGISLIYGVAATGKTTLGMLAACEEAKSKRVFFVDTEGGFSVDRVKQICGEDAERILENIFVLKAEDFDDQENKINMLVNLIGRVNCDLIVLDTLGMHYRKKLKEDYHKLVNARVRRMMDNLDRIAKHNGVAVLIMNQVYHNLEGEVKMVGGGMVKSRAKKVIQLVKDNGRYAIFEDKRFKFQIFDGGVRAIS